MTTIDPEFKSLIPPLSEDEYKQLETNILADGCREPISLWNDTILDGHNRYKICQSHGLPFETVQIAGIDSREQAINWIIDNQLGRRNLTPEQISYLRGEQHKQERKEVGARGAKEKTSQNDRSFFGEQPLTRKPSPRSSGDTAERIAKLTGVSASTVRRDAKFASAVDKIADVAGHEARTAILGARVKLTQKDTIEVASMADSAPDLIIDVMQGEKTVEQAKQELRARSNPTPVDRFKVLYADPDWESKGAGALCAMGQDIQDQSEDNSVLFLWVPSSLLEKSFDVFKSWGFKYQASFVRDLGVGDSDGQYNQANHEFLLLCVRGECEPMVRVASVVEVESRAQVKELIDLMYPDGRRFDLFDRDGEWFIEEDQEEVLESQNDEGF